MDAEKEVIVPEELTPETAKKLFWDCEGNYYRITEVLGDRNAEYKAIVDKGRLQEKWASEECEKRLKKLEFGDISDYCGDFRHMGTLAEYWISDGELLHPELLVSAWKKILVLSKDTVRIGASQQYLNRFRIAKTETKRKLLPLLDMFGNYLKFLSKEELNKIGLYGGRDEFKNLCADLRREINEDSPIEGSSFHFVPTPDAYLDIIVDSLMQKWNSTDTVKESTGQMNCAWGVENQRIYVSGVSAVADYSSPRHFDIMEFVAVIPNEKQAYLFRCRLNDSGKYEVEQCDPEAKSLIPMFEEAVEMYRNRIAFAEYTEKLDYHWANRKTERQEQYLARFPKVYRDVYARIPECEIKDMLTYMVDFAEELCSEYGGSPDGFAPPAADEEIAEWEKQHGIHIPDDYKQFLRFANGVSMPNSVEFFGLKGLGSCLEYLHDEDWFGYCDAGSFIGDGTMLCFKDDGDFYEWQDGEMYRLGSFTEAVKYICEI